VTQHPRLDFEFVASPTALRLIEPDIAPFENSSAMLLIALRSDTAYRLAVAPLIAKKLATVLRWVENQATRIEMALQEAIANAVVHGNWNIQNSNRTLEGFGDYCDEVDAALADPVRAAKAVVVEATWTVDQLSCDVSDQGAGYIELRKSDPCCAYGRGLALTAQSCDEMAWDNGRRRMRMIFRRVPGVP